tara:strand:- start:5451 stop:5855 length:405 start_codon:yes stop_codon:yes gene_type:complete
MQMRRIAILKDKLQTIQLYALQNQSTQYSVIKRAIHDLKIKHSSVAGMTINKKYIKLCYTDMRDDMNDIFYVLLHELAHIISNSWGHGKEFVVSLNELLRLAIESGAYVVNRKPGKVCGTHVGNYPQIYYNNSK